MGRRLARGDVVLPGLRSPGSGASRNWREKPHEGRRRRMGFLSESGPHFRSCLSPRTVQLQRGGAPQAFALFRYLTCFSWGSFWGRLRFFKGKFSSCVASGNSSRRMLANVSCPRAFSQFAVICVIFVSTLRTCPFSTLGLASARLAF